MSACWFNAEEHVAQHFLTGGAPYYGPENEATFYVRLMELLNIESV